MRKDFIPTRVQAGTQFGGLPSDEALEIVETFAHLRSTPFFKEMVSKMERQKLEQNLEAAQTALDNFIAKEARK